MNESYEILFCFSRGFTRKCGSPGVAKHTLGELEFSWVPTGFCGSSRVFVGFDQASRRNFDFSFMWGLRARFYGFPRSHGFSGVTVQCFTSKNTPNSPSYTPAWGICKTLPVGFPCISSPLSFSESVRNATRTKTTRRRREWDLLSFRSGNTARDGVQLCISH